MFEWKLGGELVWLSVNMTAARGPLALITVAVVSKLVSHTT
jgi:hypothetical protein